jgi:hypothetical protein
LAAKAAAIARPIPCAAAVTSTRRSLCDIFHLSSSQA